MTWLDSDLTLMLAEQRIQEWLTEAARTRAADEAARCDGPEPPDAVDTLGRRSAVLPPWLKTLLFRSSP